MENTINIVDSKAVETAYSQRNAIYVSYIEDIVKKSLWRLSEHANLDKILLDTNNFDPSRYMNTVPATVFTKFKELKQSIKAEYKDAIFTLEPKNILGLNNNTETLQNAYTQNPTGVMSMLSPVNTTISTTVADTTYALLDFVRNKIGFYTNEFTGNVKSVVASIDSEVTDNSDTEFIEVNPIQETIIYNGIISKQFSNNFEYSFNLDYDSEDLINTILNLDYENIDLNSFDMEIDTEFHRYLEEIGEDGLNSFKEAVEGMINNSFSLQGFMKNISTYKILGLKDLQVLTFIWVAAVYGYMKAGGGVSKTMFGEVVGYCEIEIKKNITKYKRYEDLGTLALGKMINNTLYIYIFVKNYLKALEKQKDITNIIKGFFIKNQPGIISLKLSDIKPEDYSIYLNTYKTYLNNIRYKQILGRINDLRDGYIYGFMKSVKVLLPLIDNNYDILDNIKQNVEEYISILKIDALSNVDETIYNIVKNLMFPKLIGTVESYMSLGEKRFPNDSDGAMIFAILLTMTEVTFSMFKVKILNKVEE